MIKEIKQRLGLYRPGKEYWVYLQDIKVPDEFRQKKIGRAKYLRKWAYYKKRCCDSEDESWEQLMD